MHTSHTNLREKFQIILQMLIKAVLTLVFKIMFRVEIVGAHKAVEEIKNAQKKGKGMLLVANHTNELDGPFLRAFLPLPWLSDPMYYVAMTSEHYNKSVFDWRKYAYGGWLFRVLGAFPAYKGITKIHKFEGRPLGLIRICVADSIYRRLPKGAIEKKKVLPMVRALPAVGALELKLIITVEPADVVLADHLRCPLGAPVARVLRRAIDTKGRGVYLALSWYRGDMFSFAATIPNELLPHLSTGIDGTL